MLKKSWLDINSPTTSSDRLSPLNLILYHVLLILQLQNHLLSLRQICCRLWTIMNPSQTDSWTQRPPTNHRWLLDQPHWQVHHQQHLLLPHPPTTTPTHGPTDQKTIGQRHQPSHWKKRRHPPLSHFILRCPPPKTDTTKTEPHLLPNPVGEIFPHEQTPNPHCKAHDHYKMCIHCGIQPKEKNCPWLQRQPRSPCWTSPLYHFPTL